MAKNCVALHVSGTIHHFIVIYGILVFEVMSPSVPSFYQNFEFFGLLKG